MGCASSNPIVGGGKQLMESAKETVKDAVSKGEHVLQETGEAAKDGMEHVKEAVESAVTTAENSLGAMVDKVGNSFKSSANQTQEQIQDVVDQVETKAEETTVSAMETVTETVSDAETVLASESENVSDFVLTSKATALRKMNSLTEEFGEVVSDAKENMNDALHIEDVEQSMDTIDDNFKNMKRKAEDLVNGLPSPPSSPTKSEKAMVDTTNETKKQEE